MPAKPVGELSNCRSVTVRLSKVESFSSSPLFLVSYFTLIKKRPLYKISNTLIIQIKFNQARDSQIFRSMIEQGLSALGRPRGEFRIIVSLEIHLNTLLRISAICYSYILKRIQLHENSQTFSIDRFI